MDNKQFRSVDSDFKVDDTSRSVSGYALVFDTQSVDIGWIETITAGALTQQICDECDVFCRFNHDPDKVLARSNKGKGSLKLTVDDIGLKYEFEAPNTDLGNSLLEYLKRGEITKSSFCFSLADEDGVQKWEKRDGKIYRTIFKIDKIYDTAPVWQPAYEDTTCDKRSKADEKMLEQLKEKSKLIDLQMDILKNEFEIL